MPQNLIDELAATPKGRAIEKGIAIAGRMIKKIRKGKAVRGSAYYAHRKRRAGPRNNVSRRIRIIRKISFQKTPLESINTDGVHTGNQGQKNTKTPKFHPHEAFLKG